MSRARAWAILVSSASTCSALAPGSIFNRSSSTTVAMRAARAGIWVSGSGGAGGGVENPSSAQPASAKIAKARMTGRSMWSGQDLEQTGRAHAAADAHGGHAIFCLATAAFDEQMAGHARARHAIGVADGNGAAIHIELLV